MFAMKRPRHPARQDQRPRRRHRARPPDRRQRHAHPRHPDQRAQAEGRQARRREPVHRRRRSDRGGGGAGLTPRQVVERWVELSSAGDADALAALYSDDAVNHQVAQEPVIGREAIRADVRQASSPQPSMVCLVEAIHDGRRRRRAGMDGPAWPSRFRLLHRPRWPDASFATRRLGQIAIPQAARLADRIRYPLPSDKPMHSTSISAPSARPSAPNALRAGNFSSGK